MSQQVTNTLIWKLILLVSVFFSGVPDMLDIQSDSSLLPWSQRAQVDILQEHCHSAVATEIM